MSKPPFRQIFSKVRIYFCLIMCSEDVSKNLHPPMLMSSLRDVEHFSMLMSSLRDVEHFCSVLLGVENFQKKCQSGKVSWFLLIELMICLGDPSNIPSG